MSKKKTSNKNFIVRITTLMIILIASAFTVDGKTITVASPGNNNDIKPAIATAVSSAVDGDMIILPAGTFTFNGTVTITKFVSIKGAGIGNTVLYRPESISDGSLSSVNMLYFNINRTTASNITVTDITFKSKNPTTSVATDMGIRFNRCIDFVVSRCRFENFGNSAIYIDHDDNLASALIFKNEFVHNYKGVDGLGLGYAISIYGANNQWIQDPKLGSSNFIFIEDNYFERHRHAVASGGCALYVCRYNTFKDHLIFHVIDTHNAQPGQTGSNKYGTRAVEVYNNTITNTTFKDGTPIVAGQSTSKLAEKAIQMCAGDALVYNNTISGFRFGVTIGIYPNPPSGTAYPYFCQPGYNSGIAYGASHTGTDAQKGDGDVFSWGNKVSLYNSSCADFYNYTTAFYKADRDYHLVAKPGYTAYTYPHPLRSLVGSVTTPPPIASVAAPTVGTITQPTCAVAKGSVVLTGLPAGSWTINPGAIVGSTTSTTISNLAAGTYNYTVTSAGTTSAPSANVIINTAPAAPAAPTLGAITQPTCAIAAGSAVLNGLPSGNWTINPGAIAGTGSSYTKTGLTAGTYNYTVTNSSGCTSAASANVLINSAPSAPTAPTVGTITQPTTTVATGSVILNGLPSGNWTLNPGTIAGSGSSYTKSGLATGTYNYTVTNESGCTSAASANIVINAQPAPTPIPPTPTPTPPTGTIEVASPGQWNNIQPAIIAAMNAANDGDILVLPAGTFCFAENVIVTKCISIKGAGIGKTILYRAEDGVDNLLSTDPKWNSMFNFSGQSCGISVTDITFRSKKPSVVVGDGLSLATDKAIQITNCVDFVISRCRFENFGLAAISVNHLDTKASGLISKNEFYHNYKGVDGLGYGYGVLVTGESKQWVSSPKLGTSNFIFIEDNTFDAHRTSISGKGSALFVARYNTIKNNILIHAINTLSAQGTTGSNYYGTRAVEIYNNNITNTTFKDGTPIVAGQTADRLTETAIMMRGGDALVYNNTIAGFRFAVNASIYPVPASATYPVISQPGYLSGLSLGANHTGTDAVNSNGDLFSYNNTFTPWAGSQTSAVFNNGQTALYKEHRDYHLVAKPGYVAYTYPHPLQATVIASSATLKSGNVKAVEEIEAAPAMIEKELVESVYPNPTVGELNIVLSNDLGQACKVEIFDIAGKVNFSKMVNVNSDGNLFKLDISDYKPGMYFLKLSSGNKVYQEKIMKAESNN